MKKRDRTRPRPADPSAKEKSRRDRQREAALKWSGVPPGIPPELVRQFDKLLNAGKTIKDLTDATSESFVVPASRFQKHCSLHPEWSVAVRKLSDANASKKKKDNHHRSVATREFCLKGLHRMEGHNLMVDPGRRRCRACFNARIQGKPMTADMMIRIKSALEGGASLAEILHGVPIGGGRRDRSLIITTSGKFNYQRKIDPAFDSFVKQHIADSNSVGQSVRFARDGNRRQKSPNAVLPPEIRPVIIAAARLKYRLKTIDGGKYADALEWQQRKIRDAGRKR